MSAGYLLLSSRADSSHGVLSDDVLLQLGKLVWSAINLEDAVYVFCRSVQPRGGARNDQPIGPRVDDALRDLKLRPDDDLRRDAERWLEAAKEALEVRNSVVHAVPVTWMANPRWPGEEDQFLDHFPRNQKRPMVRTPLAATALGEITVRLDHAREGWVELCVALWDTSPHV